MLDDFEEGEFIAPVRRHWYQFWLPRFVTVGSYTRICGHVSVSSMHFPYGPALVNIPVRSNSRKILEEMPEANCLDIWKAAK